MAEETVVAAPVAVPVASPPAGEVAAEAVEVKAPVEGEKKPEGEGEKKERHPLELENRRLRRRVENQAHRIGGYEETLRGLQSKPIDGTNREPTSDSEPLTLTRAELDRLTLERARQLAPEVAAHQSDTQRRQASFDRLNESLGAEKFTELSIELEEAMGGRGSLKTPRGSMVVDAIYASESPSAVLAYLADIDNAAELETLSRLPPVQLGRAMAKLEDKLAAKKETPQPSKAAPVIEPIKGAGAVTKEPSDMTDAEFARWRRNQIAQRR